LTLKYNRLLSKCADDIKQDAEKASIKQRFENEEYTGQIALRKFDLAAYALTRPVHAECSIFWFRLVTLALKAWCDGRKWLEVRKLHLLPANFGPGSVITLDTLGNCVVDEVFQVLMMNNTESDN